MVEKPYSWKEGAALEEHTKRKLKILREYFARYLHVRCQFPQQSRFRLAIVDGFAGGGRYTDGTSGSPLIFVEELRAATEQFNIKRASEGMAALDIECLLLLNDESRDAAELLKSYMEPLRAEIAGSVPRLHLQIEYSNEAFEQAYPTIKEKLERGTYKNVLFNLDQCGHSDVKRSTLHDIIDSFRSAEIFYTFLIKSLLAFLQKSDAQKFTAQLKYLELTDTELKSLETQMSNKAWLGTAERIVFSAFMSCAPYVSPFSIHNPEGWRYWLIHFAGSVRARQEYNNILHRNSSMQAHYGRSGLEMLSFNPTHTENTLYLFDPPGRASAKNQLSDDIPRLISTYGDAISIGEFYENIYNATPAHADDIREAIIQNPDLEVITEAGGTRRTANTIGTGDILRLKRQRSFFPMFFNGEKPIKL